MATQTIDLGSVIAQRYRVGDVHISTDPTSPASLYGGTWEQLKDVFLLAAGDAYTVGSTGGESAVTLAVNHIPAHKHKIKSHYYAPTSTGHSASTAQLTFGDTDAESNYYTNANAMSDTGGGQPHNNMPPYEVFYMWKRVA